MTDERWIKQNSPMNSAAAKKKGLCWCCAGKRVLYSAFGGQQLKTTCGECRGTGKPTN